MEPLDPGLDARRATFVAASAVDAAVSGAGVENPASGTSGAHDRYDLPRLDIAVQLQCDACGIAFDGTVGLVTDWRDRTRIEELQQRYPRRPCPACGAEMYVQAPVIILRPGDPIPVLFCIPAGSGGLVEAFEAALGSYAANADGVIPGPIASTDPELLAAIAGQYTGFALLSISAEGQEWARDRRVAEWVDAMRRNHPWPDVAAVVNRFLAADSEADEHDLLTSEPVLADPAWEPMIRRVGMLTVQAQPIPAEADAVRGKMRRLAAFRLAGRHLDTAAPEAREAVRLLSGMTTRQSSPSRTQHDVTEAIELGRQLIEHASRTYGARHPLTMTALNDTAALLLDDAAEPRRSGLEARELLARVRSAPTSTTLAVLADATTNYALAGLPTAEIPDADHAEQAIRLLRDALHLYRLAYPDDPYRALSALTNLASLTRSRLVGDPAANIAAAIALFDRAVALADESTRRLLPLPDRIMLLSNRVSALGDRAELEPTIDNDSAVLAAIDEVEPQLGLLVPDHAVRLKTVTNFGSILLAMSYRSSAVLPADAPERILGWLDHAYAHTRELPTDNATRLVAVTSLAAAHFRLGSPQHLDAAQELLVEAVAGLSQTPQPTRLHHTVYQNLAQLLLHRGNWDAAVNTLDKACQQADVVIDRAGSAATRLAQVAAAGDLFQRLAFLYAHRQDARAAIHTVERSRARWRDSARYDPDAVDRAVADRLKTGTSLLYAGVCGLGCYAVLLVPGQGAAAWAAKPDTSTLVPVLARLHTAAGRRDVEAALDAADDLLGEALIDQAVTIMRSAQVSKLAIVAGGALAGLPLGALAGRNGSFNDYTSIDYLVSAAETRRRPSTSAAGDNRATAASTPNGADYATDPSISLVVANPTGDLSFAAAELDAVRRYRPHAMVPPAGVGVRGWLLDQLPTARHLHLACHARYEPADPFASRFVLGDRLTLTVDDLSQLSTHQLELVVASCCQTGVVDQRAADEMVGLAPALIAAGARSVVAALWDIDDASTALLVAKFYDELTAGAPPSDALHRAQHRIRTLTTGEVLELIRPENTGSWIPQALQTELRALTFHPDLRHPHSRPFAHPAYWSALVYIDA